ncbi:MAG: phospholipase D family protein [Alphaproteobacteria bacterium]|nr:phospholipase D family protein [Alphaproteobacteria bacterium]
MFIKSGIIGLILFFSAVSAYAVGDDDKENLKDITLENCDELLPPKKRQRISEQDELSFFASTEELTSKYKENLAQQTYMKQLIKAHRKKRKPIERKDVTLGAESFTSDSKWQTCFTPQQKCGDFLVSIFRNAKKSIYVQAYVLSSTPIANALIEAHNAGVEVKVLVDNSQLLVSYSKISSLDEKDIKVYADVNATLAHNKVIIVDEETTITGSYNLSAAADIRNVENLIVIKDPNVTRSYLDNFISRYEDCLRYYKKNQLVPDLKESPTHKRSIAELKSKSLLAPNPAWVKLNFDAIRN